MPLNLVTAGPDEGHFIFYFGPNVDRFRREFADIGTVYLGTRHIEEAA